MRIVTLCFGLPLHLLYSAIIRVLRGNLEK